MSKWLACVIASLMLASLLAACGGGDDDDSTATSTVAATKPAATQTSTRASGGSTAAESPTVSPVAETATATATAPGTAPSRPIATTAPTEPTITATPDGTGFTAVEAALMDALLQPEDFTSDWTQDTFGLMEPDTDDDDELCGQPPFPDRDERIAGVEAEYTLNTDQPAFIIHNIVLFTEATAVDALAYARDVSSCGEWTDESGQTYTILPIDGPTFGDESYTASMKFAIEGTPYYGEYSYIRVGGAIATVAFITIEGSDVAHHRALVDVVERRLIDAELGSQGSSGELSEMLLLADDVALIDSVNVWQQDDAVDPTDKERFSVCDAGSFPDVLGSVAESGHILSANEGDGPVLMHSVVEMLPGDGTTAMEWIRAELSCATWSDEDGDFEMTETGDLDVGDDTYWLIMTMTIPGDSVQSIQVGFGFTQVSDRISVIGLAAQGGIDPERFGALIALGAKKVDSGTP